MLSLVRDWGPYLADPGEEHLGRTLRRHESTGRPLGDESFVRNLGAMVGRPLAPQKPGRKPRLKSPIGLGFF